MSTNKTQNNCRCCSAISQANGEDPISSAVTLEKYLIIEAAQPWAINIWIEPDPMPQGVLDALECAWESGEAIRQRAIAPDKEYSHPGYTRVFYYRRPAKFFAQFEKHDFILPHALVRIDFTTVDGNISSAYQARVEMKGSVMTAWNSAKQPSLEEVKQYRVRNLIKLT